MCPIGCFYSIFNSIPQKKKKVKTYYKTYGDQKDESKNK